ncbi:unnamed protein product [Rotaria socialis]|uniref:Uncharacterized protein n=4 Tax=Rotaria socialis TaxID=392032 RepID=A0A821HK50_9BILA|nr:unnamed protein product [Rotaria socialis]
MLNDNVNQMNQEIFKKQAPSTIKRVDQAKLNDPLDNVAHVHFTDGAALRDDGTWKHGNRALSLQEKNWLTAWEWTLP